MLPGANRSEPNPIKTASIGRGVTNVAGARGVLAFQLCQCRYNEGFHRERTAAAEASPIRNGTDVLAHSLILNVDR